MARVELYCPFCTELIATMGNWTLPPMFECEGCGRELKLADLERTNVRTKQYAGRSPLPLSIEHGVTSQPRGTASDATTPTIPNIALNLGDFLVMALFEWHDGTATSPGSATWGATPMSPLSTITTSDVIASTFTLFDISDTSPQNAFANVVDPAVQYATILAISGSGVSTATHEGASAGTSTAALVTLAGSSAPNYVVCYSASYTTVGPEAGETGTWGNIITRTKTAVVAGWPTSNYTIDEADSQLYIPSIPAGNIVITKTFPANHRWAMIGLAV